MDGTRVEIHPRYRALLARQGFTRFGDFFNLQSVIVSGHPGRNVSRVQVGSGSDRLTGFLKREFHVRWSEKVANALAGFGFISRSRREAQALEALPEGVGPECIAWGEDDQGRAFVLVAENSEAVDLRHHLFRLRPPRFEAERNRRRLARAIGRLVARFHQAGIEHRGLFAKHVLVKPESGRLTVIDWQRATRQGRPLDWPARLRDLAALDATLGADLASPRERLVCLRNYLDACELIPPSNRWIVRRIGDLAIQLLRKRHVREVRLSQPAADQGILWLDGEALCVTPQFHAALQGTIPGWLRGPNTHDDGLTRIVVPLPDGRDGLLVWRRRRDPLGWLWSTLRGKPLVTPEVRAAGDLFRQERQGQKPARLLAFGQRCLYPGRMESFLLTELNSPDGRIGG